jgi:hypothetical protein
MPEAASAVTMDALKALVKDRLGWDAHTPQHGEKISV